jgi:uncharacterized protein (DUF111 family)
MTAEAAVTVATTAWFHCFAGIAGDMALGALVDAGADLDEVYVLLRRIPVGGWKIDAQPVLRGGIAATRLVVQTAESPVVRTYAHITGLIDEARLPGSRARPRAGDLPRAGANRRAPAPASTRAGALP